MKTKVTPEKKRAIRNHANRNITYLLDQMGVVFDDRGDGLIQACCPCSQHGGDRDNHTAWSWRIDLGRWVCWSHACEETRGNDIFGLVSSIKGTNFPQTVNWIIQTLEKREVNLDEAAPDPENFQRERTLHIHEPLAENNLQFLNPDPVYLLNRNFDIEVLRRYEIGYWSRVGTYMNDRVVFPVRDHDGHLVAYSGRTVHPKEYFENRGIKYAKWVHGRHYNRWPQRGDLFTSSILYNLFRAKRFLPQMTRLILVEGPLDGMKLEEAGIHNWVATLGTKFSAVHRSLLVKYGVTDLYVAYDNDDPEKYKDNKSPGEEGWKRLERIVGDLLNLHRVILPEDKDCGDLEVEQLQQIFRGISC